MARKKALRRKIHESVLLFVVIAAVPNAQISMRVQGTLPSAVNNSTNIFFPPIVDQGARESCANAAGIGYVFTYEINAIRNASGKNSENIYPFFYTYDFLNDGSEQKGTYRMFLDAWRIGQENGIANVVDFGASDLSSTRWVSGYERYFRIMQNRVDLIDSLAMVDTNSLREMKQWLYDHGNGSQSGGLFLCNVYMYGIQEDIIASGPEAGKTMIKYWGSNRDSTSLHAITIVGYNDSVRLDFNGDKKFTNTLDISDHEGKINAKDGKIDLADWEIGAFLVVNSWGTSWGYNGFGYAPYRSLFISFLNGGILGGNRLYFLTVKKDYQPKMALKASITDSLRNTIALSVGVSFDPQAIVPSTTRSFSRQFTYAGGAYPMCGKGASPSIEIGLDVSDLLDSLKGNGNATFYLVVDSKAKGGYIDSVALMDYTSGKLLQTNAQQKKVALTPGSALSPARTCVGVAWTASGALSPSVRGERGQPFRVEIRNSRIRISPPVGIVKSVAILNVRGERLPSVRYHTEGEYLVINVTLPRGTYFVDVSMENGNRIIRKIIGT